MSEDRAVEARGAIVGDRSQGGAGGVEMFGPVAQGGAGGVGAVGSRAPSVAGAVVVGRS